LDGVAAAEERIIFMTTNHAGRLDPALVRPGRVDINKYVGHATADQSRRMFLRFYPGREDLADQFVKELQGMTVSTAQLQGHFVIYKDDPVQALENVKRALDTV
jgi:mitochondrial chaperone BCS1